jgi:hypothetical protein
MFGMDAMVDQAGRVWLLELNCDPDLKVFDDRFNHVAKVREHLPPPSRTLLTCRHPSPCLYRPLCAAPFLSIVATVEDKSGT